METAISRRMYQKTIIMKRHTAMVTRHRNSRRFRNWNPIRKPERITATKWKQQKNRTVLQLKNGSVTMKVARKKQKSATVFISTGSVMVWTKARSVRLPEAAETKAPHRTADRPNVLRKKRPMKVPAVSRILRTPMTSSFP